MTQNRARFRKPMELYKVLAVWGSNIVVSEDEEWKKHRKTANPAFTEVFIQLMFARTALRCAISAICDSYGKSRSTSCSISSKVRGELKLKFA